MNDLLLASVWVIGIVLASLLVWTRYAMVTTQHVVTQALTGLSATHLQALEIVTQDITALNKRVAELERYR